MLNLRRNWMLIVPVALVGVAAFIAVGGWVVMRLWNWLLPPLFGWHLITFWQALGLLLLCRILFGSFAGGGHAGARARRRAAERWERLSPEERERFRQTMHGQPGFEPPTGAGPVQ